MILVLIIFLLAIGFILILHERNQRRNKAIHHLKIVAFEKSIIAEKDKLQNFLIQNRYNVEWNKIKNKMAILTTQVEILIAIENNL